MSDAPHTDTPTGDDCRAGARNRYFRGKTLKAEDFDKEQRYFIGRRRLLTRSVLGWGVVDGLVVDAPRAERPGQGHRDESPDYEGEEPHNEHERRCDHPGPISVGPGLALDRHGREIDLRAARPLDVRNTFLITGDDRRPVASIDDVTPHARYVLSIHYAERQFGDANLPDGCGCEHSEKKYVCETAVFSLTKIEKRCPCGEPSCRPCECGARSSCGRHSRGPHACLCEWTAGVVDLKAPPLCEWRGYEIDPKAGVELACVIVEVRQGTCDFEIVGCEQDGCSPRRLVKNNDLLYDLIRGCDLAHISWISWAKWHRSGEQMPWSTFAALFDESGRTELVVRFSQPVLAHTLDRDVIAIDAVTTEQATGWRVARRMPIVSLDLTPDEEHYDGKLPRGTTNQMRVIVRPEWVGDEIAPRRDSWLSERDFRIEIEIYGDYILDCHAQAIDAEPVGRRPAPTGNGSPGGTYRSTFRVKHKDRWQRDDRDAE
jgi:hypothetical protein